MLKHKRDAGPAVTPQCTKNARPFSHDKNKGLA